MSDQRESNPHFHLGKVTLGHSTMIADAETPYDTGHQRIPFAFENTTGITPSRLIQQHFSYEKVAECSKKGIPSENPHGQSYVLRVVSARYRERVSGVNDIRIGQIIRLRDFAPLIAVIVHLDSNIPEIISVLYRV